ncbi:hypothetical protein, partial [Pyramidobacter piscolens]|uniref:hypothetical protein n=1 Tax=Pyramidobacter piscolens TaxID=638849 RepID=UPI003AF93DC2
LGDELTTELTTSELPFCCRFLSFRLTGGLSIYRSLARMIFRKRLPWAAIIPASEKTPQMVQ